MLNRDSDIVICSRLVNCELWSCDLNSTLGSVVPLAMFFLFSGRQNWISHNVGVTFFLFLLNPSTHPLIVQYWLFEKKCGSLQCIILFRDVIWRLRLESRFKVGDFMIQAPLEKSSWSSSAQTLHSRFYLIAHKALQPYHFSALNMWRAWITNTYIV